MFNAEIIADEADVIINGYAVLRCKEGFKVCNLNTQKGVAVFSSKSKLIETNMAEIEAVIAEKYLEEALAYMEEGADHAEVLSV